ncbi:cytochrome c oxidase subunit II [Verticiella sediminum]|uniref:Cytochrome c oxidase subunit 2 n=1 Tax=Verticiella sediminum TaxID=1247510 RepID=A0A556AKB8_9BURK|nr:cytochrome c oxidase subunit II [Verticiella sediminum]TSH93337.1 cytochrome c oxidase subunit II [Verticiella sediminum]
MKKWLGVCLGVVGALACSTGRAWERGDSPGGPAVNQLNMHEPVTQIAAQIHWLHWLMLGICLFIFVAVFGVMFYSIWAHRKSRGVKPATFHESLGVEVAWTVVPFLIVIAMALPATSTVVAMKDTSSAELTVKATGYQWKWGYEYLEGEGAGIAFLSNLSTPRAQIDGHETKNVNYLIEVDQPLVVPVDTKVRVVTTAADVIHSWMVPALGVKQDAFPGILRDTWFRAERTGEFRGQCAELCGKDHAYMPIVVKVVEKDEYVAWVEEQQKLLAAAADDPTREWTGEELIARGEKVYASNCVACHQATGQGVPGSFPALDGDKVVLGPKAGQIDVLLHGKPGTAMASFAQLSDVEIAAVITYSRNAWGNQGNGEDPVVQPADITSAR